MNKHSQKFMRMDASLDLQKRIALVLAVHQNLGYVDRKSLMNSYGFSQLEASALMRDFLNVHAKDLEWDLKQAHYKMKS